MTDEANAFPNRRDFIKAAGVATALGTVAIPQVYAQDSDDTIQLALVGCGGRGTGAAIDALSVTNARTRLVAMADLFENRLSQSIGGLRQKYHETPDRVSVPQDRQFVGFDAYRRAMDALRPGDIVILTTPPAFRWVHYQYAIQRGIHVFMEKPVTVDAPTSRRMLDLAKVADEKGIKSAVGLMVRHCRGRQELHQRISNGEIGDIVTLRASRMHGPLVTCFSTRKPPGENELMWQVRRFHSFIWASGGLFSDFYIHQIDETCWMKNAWPVRAHALGGRHYREDYIDQNFDTYSVEYTFEDGAKLFFDGRTMPGCRNHMSSVAHGSKGSAFISTSGHSPGRVRIFSGQRQHREDVVWAFPQPEKSPYRLEWHDLIEAVVNNTPYNEVPRGVQASLVTSMGRLAAHTGHAVTYEQMLNHPHELAPEIASFSTDSPAPLTPNQDGSYPVPMPGKNRDTEYQV